MEQYKYKISVIIPIYNVEKYLEETIKSIIHQDIGFKNIQMILVNDGSPDNSDKICEKYAKKYPNNIVYVAKENGGVSSARNAGIELAEGKYVNFMDSDDKLSKNAYRVGYKMLEQNPDVNLVCYKIKQFDATKAPHNSLHKFLRGDRIIDLKEEPYNPLYHCSSVLVKKDIVKKYRFDTKIEISEDVKYISDVISEGRKMGLIASATYYYRKRKEQTSAIQTSQKKLSYYNITPKYCYEYVLDLADKYPDLKNYYQHAIVYDLKWRILNTQMSILNDKQKKEYTETIRKIINRCSDKIICEQVVDNKSKIFRELNFKYNKNIEKDLNIKDNYIYFKDNLLMSVDELYFNIYDIDIKNEKLIINSYFDLILNNDYKLYAKIDNKYIEFKKKKNIESKKHLYSEDGEYYFYYYDIEIEIEDINSIEFYIKIDNQKYKIKPKFISFSKLNDIKSSYYRKGKYLLTHNNGNILINEKRNFKLTKYLIDLIKKRELLPFGMIILYYLAYIFFKHDNWIVSDRYDVAGDNGEHIFKYIRKNSRKRNVYFALKKGSKDIKKMMKYGKILYFNTPRYYLNYLNSEVVISSHADPFIHKPFGRKQIYLNFICKRKYVFLQHGIIKCDMSNWLRKSSRNFDMFVCSTNGEYKSVIDGNYDYDEDVVKLTGMPRFDNLLDNNKAEGNIIALMPTWRSTLVGPVKTGTQNRIYNNKFRETEYFKFYNGLINDKSLHKILEEKNIKILFCLHPSFKSQLKDFDKNKYVDIECLVDYPSIFKKASLMITDYSSVFFDFAYIKKPIIYTQFDKDYLHDIHPLYDGDNYFSYEKDGFGKVVYNYDDALKHIIDIIKNDFKNEDKYLKRIEKTFAYTDKNNCKRVYDEIIKLLSKK